MPGVENSGLHLAIPNDRFRCYKIDQLAASQLRMSSSPRAVLAEISDSTQLTQRREVRHQYGRLARSRTVDVFSKKPTVPVRLRWAFV